MLDTVAASLLRDLVAEVVTQLGTDDAPMQGAVERAYRYALRLFDSNLRTEQRGESQLLQDVDEHFKEHGKDSAELHRLVRQLSQVMPEDQRIRVLEAVGTICAETCAQQPSAAEGLRDLTNQVSGFSRASLSSTGGLGPSLTQSMHMSLTQPAEAWSHLSSEKPALGHLPVNAGGDTQHMGDALNAPASLEGPLAAVMSQIASPLSASMACNSDMIQDIIHACQGIDGRLIKLEGENPYDQCYRLTDEGKDLLSAAQKSIMMQLCELGWLYRRVRQLALPLGKHHAGGGAGHDGPGKLHQAFGAAVLHNELKEFYRLMAVLQAMALRPVQQPGGPVQEGYLTPRRLLVWLLDPLRRMRILARLAEVCHDKKGGQLANVVYAHTLTGDLFRKAYVTRILRHVCVPVFQMINRWVFEGELDDPFGDFFVAAANAPAGESFDLWRDEYYLRESLVPTFVRGELAHKILRAGKSINFLRQCCDDVAWVQENAADAMQNMQAEMQFDQNGAPIEMLQGLVDQASATVDQRLKGIMLDRFGFKRHCLALKQYLFFSQGDFVSELLHQIADSLAKKASQVSELELTDKLKKAIDASNSKFHEDDILDRLRVRKAQSIGIADRGWDVFCLKYQVRPPLSTLLTPRIMKQYEQISTFLWKLKHVEHTLQQCWVVLMKVEATMQRALRSIVAYDHTMWVMLSKANHLRSEMSNFCQNLQTYIMYEVLESAWNAFQSALDKARDMDEVMKAHEDYLSHIIQQSLMDERTEKLRETLTAIFDSCHQLLAPLQNCCNEVQTAAAALVQHNAVTQTNVAAGEWGARESPISLICSQLASSAVNAKQRVSEIKADYETRLSGFTDELQTAGVDLRFLMMRIDFTEFYASQKESLDGGNNFMH